jgi:hypothetical protein
MENVVRVDTFCIMENQVWHFKVEITNFKSLSNLWIHYKFVFAAVQEHSLQQKSDQMKILHLYEESTKNVVGRMRN